MNDDMTNIYDVEVVITTRIKTTCLGDNKEEMKEELVEFVKDWKIQSGDELLDIQISRYHKIGEYNLETDEEFLDED